MDDFCQFFVAYQDHAAPRLDVYEQAIYLYIARHTLAINEDVAVIGFKSARKEMAFGTGKAGTPPSEGVIYRKLKGLESKGFIKVLASERTGTRIKIFTPFEIKGVVAEQEEECPLSLEDADFFEDANNRQLILERDGFDCFYCLRGIDENSYVIEHVVSRPEGTNSYRNLVASCRQCNNRKGAEAAEDFLRTLYREGFLTMEEQTERQEMLSLLKSGGLKPRWPAG